ncbi:TPA: murein biosynthesis integral membrane protein MurJ [Candidatus Collierbacteria bacterium]|nr:MAG: Integral membrane protein MviN [Microgenomates group bacterium GW2011_GWB1_46_7]HBD02094.1 murein biosynthesis integral membrane protein MurJ [Candidatus Collierbacteria bacterium]HBO10739.1 murein biosynthesis integral membrane protein MurJ [Candidatus Collierbacteria bacterium]
MAAFTRPRIGSLIADRRLSTLCFLMADFVIGMRVFYLTHCSLSTDHCKLSLMFKRFMQNGRDLFAKESSSILSAATIIMGATLASALLGLIRTRLLISYFYSEPAVVDVFWAAFRLPDMVFQVIIVGALSSAFIPVFSRFIGDKDAANHLANSMINLTMGVMSILSLGIIIFAAPLSRLIAGGFTPSQLDLMVNLTRIMAIAQLFFGFSSFLTGIIQSHQRFLIPALSPILYNFGIILGILFLGKPLGIYGPAFGVVIGAILHLLAQLPLAHQLGFRYRPTLDHKNPAVSEMSRLMLPRMLTLSLTQIEATMIITFSTWLSSGTVTLISLAQQLANLPVRLIGIPIGQASLPFFAKVTHGNNLKDLASMVNNTILEMLYLALPASVIILILRVPLVRLAYGADSFPWSETVLTGKLVAILAISIAARSLTHVLVRVFYAMHDTRTPLIINTISTVTNVSLSYYFLFVLKSSVLGMAAAISIASLIETIVLVLILYSLAQFALVHILFPLGKILFASALTALALWAPLRILDQMIFDTTRTIPLIMLTLSVTLIGTAVYLTLSYLFNIRELGVFLHLIEKIGNWQKALGQSKETLDTSESSV